MITEAKAKEISVALSVAHEEVAKRFGLQISPVTLRYTDATIRFTASMVDPAETRNLDIDSKYIRAVVRNGHMYGLSLADIGRSFLLAGVQYTFMGLSGKHAVVSRQSTSKAEKLPPEIVRAALNLAGE